MPVANVYIVLYVRFSYEFYARDTSRKIKSVFKAKGMSGKHMTGTVIYGYLWDEKRENWIVDEEAAAIVRRIFAMTLEGYGPYQISSRLSQEKIEIPSVHLARYGEGVNQNRAIKDIPSGRNSSGMVCRRYWPGFPNSPDRTVYPICGGRNGVLRRAFLRFLFLPLFTFVLQSCIIVARKEVRA